MTPSIDDILTNAENALLMNQKPKSASAPMILDNAAKNLGISKEFLSSKLSIAHIGENDPSLDVTNTEEETLSPSDGYYPDLDESNVFSLNNFDDFESTFSLSEAELFGDDEIDSEVEPEQVLSASKQILSIHQPGLTDILQSINEFMDESAISQNYEVQPIIPGGVVAQVTLSERNNPVEAILSFASEQLGVLIDKQAGLASVAQDVPENTSNSIEGETINAVVEPSEPEGSDAGSENFKNSIQGIDEKLISEIQRLQSLLSEASPTEQINQLNEKFTYVSNGVALEKFPKEYAKESTTKDKRSKWFQSQINAAKPEYFPLSEITNLMEDALAQKASYQLIYQLGCLSLFGNAEGATDSQRQLTKEELAAIETERSIAAHQEMIAKAMQRVKDQKEIEKINAENTSTREALSSVLEVNAESLQELLKSAADFKIIPESDLCISEVSESQAEMFTPLLERGEGDNHYGILDGLEVTLKGSSRSIDKKVIQRIADSTGQILIWAKSSEQVDMVHDAIKHFSTKHLHEEKLVESEKQVANLKAEIMHLSAIVKEIRDDMKAILKSNSNASTSQETVQQSVQRIEAEQIPDDKFAREVEKGVRKLNLQSPNIQIQPSAKALSAVATAHNTLPTTAANQINGLELKLLATVEQKVLELVKKSVSSTQNVNATTLYISKSELESGAKIKEAVLRLEHFNTVYHVRVDETGKPIKMHEGAIQKLDSFIEAGYWVSVTSPSIESLKTEALSVSSNNRKANSLQSEDSKNSVDDLKARSISNMSP